jgi:hypothetical protein
VKIKGSETKGAAEIGKKMSSYVTTFPTITIVKGRMGDTCIIDFI